jgi:penicillin V acylase-like amidase (Ntn superfamily)
MKQRCSTRQLAVVLVCSALSLGLVFVLTQPANACSRVFSNDNGIAMVIGRTMDLYMDDKPALELRPRGQAGGGFLAVDDANPLTWTSRYGSVGIQSLNQAVSDGMNEKGLDANLLYLSGAHYEARDMKRPGLSNLKLVDYVLANFSTVSEVLAALATVQVVPDKAAGREWPLHLSVADASGDSAVIEFIDGRLVVHHGKQVQVLTNEPPLDIQLANLKRYKAFGGVESMPGDINPEARFVRASAFLRTLPKPKTDLEVLAGVYQVMKTVSAPAGAQDTAGGGHEDAWPTRWTTLADVTDGSYYFQSADNPYPVWVELKRLNLKAGEPTRLMDLKPGALSGDVSALLDRAPRVPLQRQ